MLPLTRFVISGNRCARTPCRFLDVFLWIVPSLAVLCLAEYLSLLDLQSLFLQLCGLLCSASDPSPCAIICKTATLPSVSCPLNPWFTILHCLLSSVWQQLFYTFCPVLLFMLEGQVQPHSIMAKSGSSLTTFLQK